MAWLFSLSVECGPHRQPGEALFNQWQHHKLTTAAGHHFDCHATLTQDPAGAFWVTLTPLGVSQVGVRDDDDASLFTEIGDALYQLLKGTTHDYRFALVGVEVDHFATFDELVADAPTVSGLVVAEALWRKWGSPAEFVPFSPGHVWVPYGGEHSGP